MGVGAVETFDQAVTVFETVGMPAKNLAARTRREYASDLRDLVAFLTEHEITHLAMVGLRDLEAYLAELDRRGLKGSSRNRKTHTIKTFFKWLETQEVLAVNPATQLVPPKANKKEPRFLSEDEYRRLLRACSHNARDAAIIEIFLQTGMRLSELAHLTINDVELPKRITRDLDSMGSVRVRRKGGKLESIPLNYKACQALAAYLKVRPKVDNDALFVTKFKSPMTARAIEYMVAKYLADAGIPNASVHTLRHTMATHHVAQGTDLKTVQETLGHASLATTSIYVSLAKQAQKKALQEHAL
ncbi:MAG TPA: tyrosine-type recombinase/integrase [Herpetosiphonaceae bacterium]|nr:tyrosine-type recombinase/integrase [Herpetosiphonaceae bacterium]